MAVATVERLIAMRIRVVVNDRMQRGYVYYRTEPIGKNFAPGFHPDLTPNQMLQLGVFGGKYTTDCRREFPSSWFRRAKLSPTRHDPKLNYFGVNASQSLATWRRKGWIHKQDPRGWFQWYCRYYMGRRTATIVGRFVVGERLRVTWRRSAAVVSHAISNAGGASDRPCCTGRMTAAPLDSPCTRGISSCLFGDRARFDLVKLRFRPIFVGCAASFDALDGIGSRS